MGLFGSRDDTPQTEPDGPLDKLANAFVGRIVDAGIDGVGPLTPSSRIAADALRKHGGNVEKAVSEVISDHVKKAGVVGFVTGVGGLVTMPVSLPANVVGFYTLATRMDAAIAELRGYDVTEPGTRTAVLLALVGGDADDLLQKAGLNVVSGMSGSGRLARLATSRMPKAAAMMINKAVGFRLLTTMGSKALSRFVRFVPLAGGIVGAGLDGVLMKRLGDHARAEFTPLSSTGRALEDTAVD